MAVAASVEPAPSPEQIARSLLDVLRAFLAETRSADGPVINATLDSRLERDLGLDSLGRYELWLRVEQTFGVSVSDDTLAQVETPRDMLRALLAGSQRQAHAADVVRLAGDRAETAPDTAATLLEVLDWHIRAHPDRTTITVLEGDEVAATLTYADLARDVAAVAGGLQREGLEPRQAVAIMLPTGREFFAAYYGTLAAGGVPVPIYPPVRLAQLADHVRRQAAILQNCAARVLVTFREAKPVGLLLRGQVASLAHVVTVPDLAERGTGPAPVRVTGDDVAFIQYTSGSTGNPKGVVLTHANLLANMRAMIRATGATPADVFVSWLPLYHDMGLIGAWLNTLYCAIPLVVMSPLAFLARPARWLWAIHRYRGTISAGPNFAYQLAASRRASRSTGSTRSRSRRCTGWRNARSISRSRRGGAACSSITSIARASRRSASPSRPRRARTRRRSSRAGIRSRATRSASPTRPGASSPSAASDASSSRGPPRRAATTATPKRRPRSSTATGSTPGISATSPKATSTSRGARRTRWSAAATTSIRTSSRRRSAAFPASAKVASRS